MTLLLRAAAVDTGAAERRALGRALGRIELRDGGAGLVVARSLPLERAAQALVAHGWGALAFEVCACACAADGLRTDRETRFLAGLGPQLGLSHERIVAAAVAVDAFATLPYSFRVPTAVPAADDAAMRRRIAAAAASAATLERLAQPAAMLAVGCLQQRLAQHLAAAHGAASDVAAVRELAEAAGVGFVAQFVESMALALLRDGTGDADGAGLPAFASTVAFGHALRRGLTRGAAAPALHVDFVRLARVAYRRGRADPQSAAATVAWRAGTVGLRLDGGARVLAGPLEIPLDAA